MLILYKLPHVKLIINKQSKHHLNFKENFDVSLKKIDYFDANIMI